MEDEKATYEDARRVGAALLGLLYAVKEAIGRTTEPETEMVEQDEVQVVKVSTVQDNLTPYINAHKTPAIHEWKRTAKWNKCDKCGLEGVNVRTCRTSFSVRAEQARERGIDNRWHFVNGEVWTVEDSELLMESRS